MPRRVVADLEVALLTISKSVGSGGVNIEKDVETVQTLLNMVPIAHGGANPVVDIDGWNGRQTERAIRAFQMRQFKQADGRVDPGKRTINQLNTLAAAPGARTTPPPDMEPRLLAMTSIPLCRQWIGAALKQVNDGIAAGGDLSGLPTFARNAFSFHFKLPGTLAQSVVLAHLQTIKRNFEASDRTVLAAHTHFKSVSRKQTSIDLQSNMGAPAYVPQRRHISFTPFFHTFNPTARPGLDWTEQGEGPKCRAAMVVHETIHLVDGAAQFDIYEHGPEYATMPVGRAVHCASSYPSFGAQVDPADIEFNTSPAGPLYGAGRIQV
jgi:hypothetical protein